MDTPVSRSALYGKLTKSLFRSLESATTFCKLRANPYVELTHWLHQLIQQPENDIHNVLRHYKIISADVEKALIQQLNILPAGASVINDFSHHIDLSVEKAWMLASVRFGDQKIRSGWLLLAWLTTPELYRVLKNICAPLAGLPVDELLDILPSLITSSPELTEMPYDGSDLNSAVPGEASQVFAGESTGSKSVLAKYCQDMTALAREGNIDPVTGREHEIRTMTDILLRRRQNNPLLTGEAGVGKTAVVEGFALAIVGGEVPPSLRNVRLLSLDVGALLAGASMKGEFESRLKALLEEAARSPQPVILFVDEVHTLVGAGGTSGIRSERGDALAARITSLNADLSDTEARWQQELELVRSLQEQRGAEPGKRDETALQQSETALRRWQGENPAVFPEVNAAVVAAIVSDWTGIPAGRMVKDEASQILELPARLAQRVTGQTDALAQISERIQTARAGLGDPRKPVGVFLLAGPSGVGKTETALALAEAIYGGEQNLITINMSEFQESHTVSTLKGAPPGYVGYGEGGVLTEAVRRHPWSVVLLDEIEKAHHDVHELFFQVFDKGAMEDGEGVHIDFKNTTLLLTTNVGAELISQLCEDPALMLDSAGLKEALMPELRKHFPAAFLGRVTVIPYLPLDETARGVIARLHLDRLKDRMAEQHGVSLVYGDEMITHIVVRCPMHETGARLLIGYIEQHILPPLSRYWLQAMTEKTAVTQIRMRVDEDEQVIFETVHEA